MTTYYNYLGQLMPVSADPGANGVHASGAGQTLTAPTGPSALYAYDTSGHSFDNDTFIGSNGDNTFYVNNSSDLVQVAANLTGVKTIVSWSGGYTLPANVQNLTFYGAWNWGAGNSLNNLIIMGGNDHATLDGGGGNDVLVGGFGENDFQFEVGAGGGHDVFYGFHPSLDTVRISGSNFTSFSQVQSAMQQAGSDVVLTIDSGDSITFRNTTIAQFTPQNFLLPLDTSQLGPMTFDDEFNSLQLWNGSSGHWQTNFGGDLTSANAYFIQGNDEKQLYTAPNFVGQDGWNLSAYNPFSIESGGVLDITAGKFSYADSQHTWGQAYYSGMLNTRGVFEQQYGYFEMRAELPTDLGSWPAFWLSQDPYNGAEADVLEHLAMYPDVDFSRANDAGTVTGHTAYMPSLSGFHTYGMLWGPTTTTFYIDDLAVMSLPTPASWNKPMYMIIDMALGGWGGPIDATALPAEMKVDYVRVYGLAGASTGGDPPPSTMTGSAANDWTATFDGVYRQYTVGTGGTTVSGGPEGGTDDLANIQRIQFVDGYLTYSTTDTAAEVYRLYWGALGRAPDQEGQTSWTNALNAGVALPTVAGDFVGSAEFQADYGALSNSAFVTLLYSNVLHRNPDQAGFDAWVNALNSGTSRAQVVLGFTESQEDINDLSAPVQQGLWVGNYNAAEVARLYDTTLHRLPDLGGLTGWTHALQSGTPLLQVTQGFVGSAEFQATYGSLDNNDFVTLLYENSLHRAPDQAGLDGWVSALNSGTTRAQVVLGFSDSPEHIQNTAPHIDNGIWLA